MAITQTVQELSPGAIVSLLEVDLTSLGDSLYRFHNGTNELDTDVTWQGNVYTKFPVDLSGFESSSKGAIARPTLKIANVTGVIVALLKSFDDMIGGKVTRKRTMVKYIDAINFASGVNASADPNSYFPDDIYFIDRKVSENKIFVEFELISSLDISGVKIPRRQIIQNSCTWIYRSAECTYAGGAVADSNDNATADLALDVCGKRLSSCRLRFGTVNVLPYGGFPGSGLLNR